MWAEWSTHPEASRPKHQKAKSSALRLHLRIYCRADEIRSKYATVLSETPNRQFEELKGCANQTNMRSELQLAYLPSEILMNLVQQLCGS